MPVVRHVIFAYMLLFLTLALLVKLIFAPLFSAWQEQDQVSQSLQASVRNVKAQLQSDDQNKQLLQSELQSLLESGMIGVAAKASDAGHRLQERVKLLLKPHSVKISQLRPSNILVSNSLSKSGLELSLQLSSESLQPLLNALLNSAPCLHIELISVRSSARYSTQIKNDLEVNLTLSMWYIEDSFLAGKKVQFNAPKPAEEKVWAGGNILAGLFNTNSRRHFSSPSPKHYRLAAINVSQNARIAIIANTADGLTRRLEQGDLLDVWRVESIESNGVNLTFKDRSEVLTLSR